MNEGTLVAALAASTIFDLQLLTDDNDPDLGPALEIDIDALGDDPVKLKSMLGKALHDNRKVRTEAGKRRTALRAVEKERDEAKALVATETEKATKAAGELETANRANGQYRSNFQKRLVDGELRSLLTAEGAVDIDLMLPAIKRETITCDDETFEIKGVKEAVEAFKTEKPSLFTKQTTTTRGTSRTGTGAGSGSGGGGNDDKKVDYRDSTKSLEQLERESDMARFGASTVGVQ